MEAGQFGHGGSKKKSKRKKTEQVLDTGQKRIVDFFIKKAEASLIRETANVKNQGAGNSPLLGASDQDASGLSSRGGVNTQSEERGRIEKRRGTKRILTVLDRWPHEANNPTRDPSQGEQEDPTEDDLKERKTILDKDKR